MLAIKYSYSDIKEGREFKAFSILNTDTLSLVDKYVLPLNEEDPTLNELRFKTGISEIYAILDFGSWNNYWDKFANHRQNFIELDRELAQNPEVLKSIAEYEKDQKQFRIWQAAKKWDVN